jgi:hypothetical protein
MTEVDDSISRLSLNASCGNDGIWNEFLRYGNSDSLATLLTWLFNRMIVTGHVPEGINI